MKVVHISIYPQKGKKHSGGGLASYTKNLVQSTYRKNDEIVILCEKKSRKRREYVEENVRIIRCFNTDVRFTYQIATEVWKIHPDVIHFQQELGIFGPRYTALLQHLLLFFLKKYRVVTTIHGIVDLDKINRRFVKENSSNLPVWLVKKLFYAIYKPVCLFSDKIIVHEKVFKDTLMHKYKVHQNKTTVIPHGIENFKKISKADAKSKLNIEKGKKVIAFVGYYTGYKGLETLIDGFAIYAEKNKKALLLVGAGMHPKLKHEKNYSRKYNKVKKRAQRQIRAEQLMWKGFIDEADLQVTYSAADVIVFPYTVCMASSGPMSMAIGYKIPIVVSDVFNGVIDDRTLLFKNTPENLAKKLSSFFVNVSEYKKATSKLRKERLWTKVGKKTRKVYVQLKNEN